MSASLEQYKDSLESKLLHDLLIGLMPTDRLHDELRRFPHLLVKGPFVTFLNVTELYGKLRCFG